MRITGGSHRSRALVAPSGTRTRPTSDRVREALFGILNSQGAVVGTRVLDLYAGTGALAYEALSRGADAATLVDGARDAIASCRTNCAALGFEANALILASTIDRATSAILARGPFDLVFADPPYADVADAVRALHALAVAEAFAADAVIVLEHAARDLPDIPLPLVRDDVRRYGDTALSFLSQVLPDPGTDA